LSVSKVKELPGEGLVADVQGKRIKLSGRKQLTAQQYSNLPISIGGLETILIIDDEPSAIFHFYDQPRVDAKKFISHLKSHHNIERVVILSGDRSQEAERIGSLLGLNEIYANLSPEEKVHYVVCESEKAPTLFVGDGINDAPALSVAHVGIALGKSNSITSQAAGAVILEPSLSSLDELLHIGISMRSVALQSALGGMALSIIAMGGAACGLINPIMGALIQEAIDLLAVMNALRTSSISTKRH
jgi:P-type E1-E2 ATPase